MVLNVVQFCVCVYYIYKLSLSGIHRNIQLKMLRKKTTVQLFLEHKQTVYNCVIFRV